MEEETLETAIVSMMNTVNQAVTRVNDLEKSLLSSDKRQNIILNSLQSQIRRNEAQNKTNRQLKTVIFINLLLIIALSIAVFMVKN